MTSTPESLQLEPQRLRVGMDRGLGRAVDRVRRQGDQRQPRRHVDDRAAIGDHYIHQRGGHADHAPEVDVDLCGQLGKVTDRRLEVHCAADTGIVHQHVEIGEFLLHPRSERRDLPRVGDVALDCMELGMLSLHRVENRLATAGDDDLVAELEELEREGEANAGGTAGYEDGATGDFDGIFPCETCRRRLLNYGCLVILWS